MENTAKRPGIGVLIGTLILLVIGCGERSEPASADESVLSEAKGFSLLHYRDAQLRWELTAETSRVLDSDTMEVLRPVVRIYDQGIHAVTLTGDIGWVQLNTHNVTLRGEVRAVSKEAVLTSRELRWYDERGRLISPGPVRIRRGDSVLDAAAMESSANLSAIQLKRVRFTLYPHDEQRAPYPLEPTERRANETTPPR